MYNFNAKITSIQSAWKRLFMRKKFIMAAMNAQWSQLESDLKSRSLSLNLQSFQASEVLGIPIKIRLKYMRAYYKIQKYEYLVNVVDHKQFIKNLRLEH
jgi:hypothetical protein